MPGDSHAGAAVGHAGREVVDVARFVASRQAALVVLPPLGVVVIDVELVAGGELLNGRFNSPVRNEQHMIVTNASGVCKLTVY